MQPTKILQLLFLFILCSANGQKSELGKVDIAELSEKRHSKDSSAAAAILYKGGVVNFEFNENDGFVMNTTVKMRIKIYKKEGYEWANHEVAYYIGSNPKESVRFSDAATYNLVDGKVEKTKLKKEGEFDETVNRYWAQKKITLPNVKEGSIIEFEYTIVSTNFSEFKDWNFQSSIPVDYAEYKANIPEYFVFNVNHRGFITPKITSAKNQKNVSIQSKNRSSTNGGGGTVTKTEYSRDSFTYIETQTKYVAENLPAMRDEAYVNNIGNYTAGLSHELSATRYPNAPMKLYATDWASVTKKIYEHQDFGPELNKTGYFDKEIDILLAGKTDQNEKIAAIFDFVKSSIKWNNYNGYLCNDGVRQAYNAKTGNVAEINLMLTAMMRYAGLAANPVLVSTRPNGIAYFPNRTAFNYVVAAVETPKGLIMLDATEEYAVPNVLPLRTLNWFGRLIRNDGSSMEVDMMPKTVSVENTSIMITPNAEGYVTGKLRKLYSEHDGLIFRQQYAGVKQESYLEKMESSNSNIEISEYKRENDRELSKPVIETYSFKDDNSLEVIGDKMYIKPLVFFSTPANPFKLEKREFPVDFGFPQQDKYNISIEIPQGFVIESIPQSLNIATEGNQSVFKYNIAQTGNKIQLSIVSDINTAIISSEYYEGLKMFFQQMVDKQNEKIVLKKV